MRISMFHESRGKYTVYRVHTKYGEFTFRKELEAVNFMLDIGTGRLPMMILDFDHLPEIYTTQEAITEYSRRKS